MGLVWPRIVSCFLSRSNSSSPSPSGVKRKHVGLFFDVDGKDVQDAQQRQQPLAVRRDDRVQIIDLQAFHHAAAAHHKPDQLARGPSPGGLRIGVRRDDSGGAPGGGWCRWAATATISRRGELASSLSRFAAISGAANGRGVALSGGASSGLSVPSPPASGSEGRVVTVLASGIAGTARSLSERFGSAGADSHASDSRGTSARDMRRRVGTTRRHRPAHTPIRRPGLFIPTYSVSALPRISVLLLSWAEACTEADGFSTADGVGGLAVPSPFVGGTSGQASWASFTTGCSR